MFPLVVKLTRLVLGLKLSEFWVESFPTCIPDRSAFVLVNWASLVDALLSHENLGFPGECWLYSFR